MAPIKSRVLFYTVNITIEIVIRKARAICAGVPVHTKGSTTNAGSNPPECILVLVGIFVA